MHLNHTLLPPLPLVVCIKPIPYQYHLWCPLWPSNICHWCPVLLHRFWHIMCTFKISSIGNKGKYPSFLITTIFQFLSFLQLWEIDQIGERTILEHVQYIQKFKFAVFYNCSKCQQWYSSAMRAFVKWLMQHINSCFQWCGTSSLMFNDVAHHLMFPMMWHIISRVQWCGTSSHMSYDVVHHLICHMMWHIIWPSRWCRWLIHIIALQGCFWNSILRRRSV